MWACLFVTGTCATIAGGLILFEYTTWKFPSANQCLSGIKCDLLQPEDYLDPP